MLQHCHRAYATKALLFLFHSKPYLIGATFWYNSLTNWQCFMYFPGVVVNSQIIKDQCSTLIVHFNLGVTFSSYYYSYVLQNNRALKNYFNKSSWDTCFKKLVKTQQKSDKCQLSSNSQNIKLITIKTEAISQSLNFVSMLFFIIRATISRKLVCFVSFNLLLLYSNTLTHYWYFANFKSLFVFL